MDVEVCEGLDDGQEVKGEAPGDGAGFDDMWASALADPYMTGLEDVDVEALAALGDVADDGAVDEELAEEDVLEEGAAEEQMVEEDAVEEEDFVEVEEEPAAGESRPKAGSEFMDALDELPDDPNSKPVSNWMSPEETKSPVVPRDTSVGSGLQAVKDQHKRQSAAKTQSSSAEGKAPRQGKGFDKRQTLQDGIGSSGVKGRATISNDAKSGKGKQPGKSSAGFVTSFGKGHLQQDVVKAKVMGAAATAKGGVATSTAKGGRAAATTGKSGVTAAASKGGGKATTQVGRCVLRGAGVPGGATVLTTAAAPAKVATAAGKGSSSVLGKSRPIKGNGKHAAASKPPLPQKTNSGELKGESSKLKQSKSEEWQWDAEDTKVEKKVKRNRSEGDEWSGWEAAEEQKEKKAKKSKSVEWDEWDEKESKKSKKSKSHEEWEDAEWATWNASGGEAAPKKEKKEKKQKEQTIDEVDAEGRSYQLNKIVVNFANVGASFGKKVYKREGMGLFDWEGIRRCVRYLVSEKKYQVIGCINENFTGTDNNSLSRRPIPADILKVLTNSGGSLEEVPRIDGDHHKSADDEATIRLAYRRNCRFLDNDNYREWGQQLHEDKIRKWFKRSKDLLHSRYMFDSEGIFELLEGNCPAWMLAPKLGKYSQVATTTDKLGNVVMDKAKLQHMRR